MLCTAHPRMHQCFCPYCAALLKQCCVTTIMFTITRHTSVPPPPIVSGLLTSVIVLVTPPTTVVTTWACWATVTVPDLCTVIMGRAGVTGLDMVGVPTWAAAVFSMRVAGLLTFDTISGERKSKRNHSETMNNYDMAYYPDNNMASRNITILQK